MVVLFKTLQVILALSILIIVHEFGHFTFAKIFGIRVEKFYLFFDIGGRHLFKFHIGETEFGIGILPFGGYCKISGMIDESLDLDSIKKEPEPWEFRTKPAWQRLFVMAGGVLFNFIFAVIIFTCMIASHGEAYIENEGNAVYVNELAYEMGFRNGDRILRFDDYEPKSFTALQSDLGRRMAHKAVILRDGDTLELYIDQAMIGEVLNSPDMFDLALPFVVDEVQAGSPNVGSGLQPGDKVIGFGGHSFEFFQDGRHILAELAGSETYATVLRDSDTLNLQMKVDSLGRIGVAIRNPEYQIMKYKGFKVVPAGLSYTWDLIVNYVRDLRLVFTPSTQAYKSVGSFIAIGQVFPSAWDWLQFINIIGILSIMLGVMNLIPIPGLDGGHIFFTIFEIVTGRKPGDKFMIVMQIIGMALIFALLMLACGNDISRLIR